MASMLHEDERCHNDLVTEQDAGASAVGVVAVVCE